MDDEAALAFGAELGAELPAFRRRTCADLVGFWLDGTKRLRRDWFGWRDGGELSPEATDLSKKQRSFYAHDAMLRFLCCFFRLVPAAPETLAEYAMEQTCLSSCPNAPPYRVPDRIALGILAAFGVEGPREVSRLRKEGARIFVKSCLDRAEGGRLVARDRLAAELTRKSLSPTTLHALGIEDDGKLRARLDAALGVEPEKAV